MNNIHDIKDLEALEQNAGRFLVLRATENFSLEEGAALRKDPFGEFTDLQ